MFLLCRTSQENIYPEAVIHYIMCFMCFWVCTWPHHIHLTTARWRIITNILVATNVQRNLDIFCNLLTLIFIKVLGWFWGDLWYFFMWFWLWVFVGFLLLLGFLFVWFRLVFGFSGCFFVWLVWFFFFGGGLFGFFPFKQRGMNFVLVKFQSIWLNTLTVHPAAECALYVLNPLELMAISPGISRFITI